MALATAAARLRHATLRGSYSKSSEGTPSTRAYLLYLDRPAGKHPLYWRAPSSRRRRTHLGHRQRLEAVGKDMNVVGFYGDGGTADIGLQALSAAAERTRTFSVYARTTSIHEHGWQRSGLTPIYASTTTTPVASESRGKKSNKKNILSSWRHTTFHTWRPRASPTQ